MKNFILFLSFLYQAMLCQAQHQIDTLAGAFIYRSTATNTHWILPKSAVMMSLNPNATNDVIGIYTFNNVQIFSGKLSTLMVPGATTNAQKVAFISKNVGTVSGGGGSGGSVSVPPNLAKEAKQDDIMMRQDVANNNQLIEIINQQKGIDTLSAIHQELKRQNTDSLEVKADTTNAILRRMLNKLGATGNYTPVLHSELLQLIANSELKIGRFYLISDYKTIYIRANYLNAITIKGEVDSASNFEPLLALAISTNSISKNVYSPLFPLDYIEYDVNNVLIEGALIGLKDNLQIRGLIVKRVDDHSNETYYDHRTILFKRWQAGLGDYYQIFSNYYDKDSTGISALFLTFQNTDTRNVLIIKPIAFFGNNVFFGESSDCTFSGKLENVTFATLGFFCKNNKVFGDISNARFRNFANNLITGTVQNASCYEFMNNLITGTVQNANVFNFIKNNIYNNFTNIKLNNFSYNIINNISDISDIDLPDGKIYGCVFNRGFAQNIFSEFIDNVVNADCTNNTFSLILPNTSNGKIYNNIINARLTNANVSYSNAPALYEFKTKTIEKINGNIYSLYPTVTSGVVSFVANQL